MSLSGRYFLIINLARDKGLILLSNIYHSRSFRRAGRACNRLAGARHTFDFPCEDERRARMRTYYMHAFARLDYIRAWAQERLQEGRTMQLPAGTDYQFVKQILKYPAR